MFRKKSTESNNELRDICRIFKHIRDSVKDIEVKSLALEIMLYNAFHFQKDYNYGQSMINALKNLEVRLNKMINDNQFQKISNPAFKNDLIKTGLENVYEVKDLITLSTLVLKVIEACVLNEKEFHGLKRKYKALSDLNKDFTSSLIPENKTIISGGVFGGDQVNED
ncbi:hypothetical protein [Spiroplasma turonicum]|uniref:Uncharacterized protein n=1 Tax=Spiroplasma turonicum TaxID=216946 RepID=A0A0K1P6J9_9MOLU|nr:hypothetical protein [Spiroplasma turonicum]AKU79834.1 hypothetical protein STURON_00588 [Spiroplasma turonicum]ALX70850.1 hypothetical protein STURO_v1c05840 [Spiroplasma turonicum]